MLNPGPDQGSCPGSGSGSGAFSRKPHPLQRVERRSKPLVLFSTPVVVVDDDSDDDSDDESDSDSDVVAASFAASDSVSPSPRRSRAC